MILTLFIKVYNKKLLYALKLISISVLYYILIVTGISIILFFLILNNIIIIRYS